MLKNCPIPSINQDDIPYSAAVKKQTGPNLAGYPQNLWISLWMKRDYENKTGFFSGNDQIVYNLNNYKIAKYINGICELYKAITISSTSKLELVQLIFSLVYKSIKFLIRQA